jgi:DNA-directed RNA polymerase specialized sigma24 family protein
MAVGEGGSVSRWIGELKAGDRDAVQPLWERYYERLVLLARAKLRARRVAAGDGEDAALSAFNSFCAGVEQGRFPRLEGRDDLWRLLVVITARKAGAEAVRQGRQKRGGGRVVTAADLTPDTPSGDGDDPFARALGGEPTPEFAASAAEECARLLDLLGEESLRRVALDRMEGYSNDEIATRLGCARRTVARRLDVIRRVWASELSP